MHRLFRSRKTRLKWHPAYWLLRMLHIYWYTKNNIWVCTDEYCESSWLRLLVVYITHIITNHIPEEQSSFVLSDSRNRVDNRAITIHQMLQHFAFRRHLPQTQLVHCQMISKQSCLADWQSKPLDHSMHNKWYR